MPSNALLEVLTPVLIDAFLAVVTFVVAWVGVELRKVQKANAENEQYTFLQRVAEVGVQAAEQLFGEFAGEQKLQYALDYAEKKLAEAGINVETDFLRSQIEAAVLREFNFAEAAPSAPGGGEVVVTPTEDIPLPGEDLGPDEA